MEEFVNLLSSSPSSTGGAWGGTEEFVNLLSSSPSSSSGPVRKFFEYCVEQAFNNIDANRDGAISYQELSNSLRKSGFSDQEIHTIFSLADHDGDGEVSLHELIRSLSK